jgi:hypothetical protein
MTEVFRTLTAVALSVAIPLGALCAPLVHAHVDGHDADHHRAHEIHAHFSDHSTHSTASGSRMQEDETGRAVYLQLFVAVAHASFHIPAAVAPSWDFVAPGERPARHSLHVVHGHDPPFLTSLPSRAPPAFPS